MGNSPARRDEPEVTAWGTDWDGAVTSHQAVAILLHVSWARWQEYAAMLQAQVAERGVAGLAGHKTAASKAMADATNGRPLYPTGEEIRALVALEGRERDRCARLAMQAHDAGVDW
jgi:hypothetical protein